MSTNDTTSGAPVFLTGFGRSGTTLCGEILNAHSQLAIAEETSFPTVVSVSLKNFGFSDARRAELERTMVRLVYDAYAQAQGKPRFGDKVFGELDGIDAVFDGTPRYVWMVRHPIDVAESWSERFSREQTQRILAAVPAPADAAGLGDGYKQRAVVLRAAAGAARLLGRVLEQRGLGERIMVCRYEDLATNPEQTVGRLCEFLGVKYEAPMIDGARFASRGVARGDTRKFRNAIDTRSVARWTKLPAEQRNLYVKPLRDDVRATLDELAAAGVEYGWDDRTN